MKESYGTLSQTINGLIKEGYTLDFNLQEDRFTAFGTESILSPNDFLIDKVFRFEGESNPDDQSVLYAISSPTLNIKGLLVNGYGISADEKTDKLISGLTTHPSHVDLANNSE